MGFTKTFFSPALIDQSPWDDVSALNVDDPDVVAKPNLPDHYAFSSVHHAWAKSRGAFLALRWFQSPSSQDSGTTQALELGGGLAAGKNPVRTKKIDGLQALDGVGGDDEGDVQRILDEWFEEAVLQKRETLPRSEFLDILRSCDFSNLAAKIPSSIKRPIRVMLLSRWHGEKIYSPKLVLSQNAQVDDRQRQSITLEVGMSTASLIDVQGINDDQSLDALFDSKQFSFSPAIKERVIAARLENLVFANVPKKMPRYAAITPAVFLDLLKKTNFDALLGDLKRQRPDLFDTAQPLCFVIKSLWNGNEVGSLALIPKSEAGNLAGHQHIHLEIKEDHVIVKDVCGVNKNQTLNALFFNECRVSIDSELREEMLGVCFEVRLFADLPKNRSGIETISREQFITLLQTDFNTILTGLIKQRPDFFDVPSRLVFRSLWQGDHIKGLAILPRSQSAAASKMHQYIYLNVDKTGICVVDVRGRNKALSIAGLLANSHISIHPFLLAQQGVSRAEEMLLLRLSEFGRTLLHNEIRRLEISRGIAVNNQTRAVDTEIVHEAAFNVLVNFGRQFVSDRDAGSAWQPNDRRFAVAQTLGRFVTVPMPREDAEAVSALLMTALLHERERTLGEYFRVIRLVGDSPIAESGWDAIFSPGLRKALRKFAAGWFAIGDVANPAADYLRDPFNEVVGAYYYHLLQGGNHADQRFEILAHVFYQQRRGDNLKPFYDGMIKASGLGEDSVHAAIRRELRAYAAQRNEWELDDEEPTRLVDGLVGGAARFVWNGTLNTSQRQMMVQMARDIFPQHVLDFPDDTNLAEILPQALFFEVLGRVAHTLADHWIANASDRNFENSIALLNMLTGLGDESAWGFRRGFGNDISARTIMQAVTDYLMQHHDEAFRSWLEDVIEYSVNQIGDGTYTTKTVQIRRTDLLARLMTGYSLRNHALVLQRFRLNNLTERQELEKAQGIWQKIQDGTSDTADRQWLYQVLNRWTAPKTGARIGGATVGERWYLIEQWVTQNGADPSGKFLDALLARITIP